jgi:hypothetical protein
MENMTAQSKLIKRVIVQGVHFVNLKINANAKMAINCKKKKGFTNAYLIVSLYNILFNLKIFMKKT